MSVCNRIIIYLLLVSCMRPAVWAMYVCKDVDIKEGCMDLNCSSTSSVDTERHRDAVRAKISAIFDAAKTNVLTDQLYLNKDEFTNELCGTNCNENVIATLGKVYNQIIEINRRDSEVGVKRYDAVSYFKELLTSSETFNPSFEEFVIIIYNYFDYNGDGQIKLADRETIQICNQYISTQVYDFDTLNLCMDMAEALFPVFDQNGRSMEMDYLSSESEEEREPGASASAGGSRRILPRINFQFDSVDFQMMFRLPQGLVETIAQRIGPQIDHESDRNHSLTVKEQVLFCLDYLGRGGIYSVHQSCHGPHRSTNIEAVRTVFSPS